MSRALGRYELLRPLARGGMAEVYLARRRAAGIEKWLVVKRMRPETSGDPRFLDLFVREARLSMSLVHQNIVPVFDFGKIDDQVFLAMERVEGKDLGSSLARAANHQLPPLLTAFIAAECCQALDYAHQRKGPDGVALGIVHRDVTPRNVLLSWSGEVKLTDFGIAALAGDASRAVLGTPLYMAPEQARSEPCDPRADIYAIGLVMREALSGQRSRPGTDREAILEAARRGDLLPWSHAEPAELATGSGDHSPAEPPPGALIAIIDRATAAQPVDRYPDARAMLEALDGFMVAERSAHKTDAPARQLATWLATVWEGARDDVELGAGVAADHLVSFLDDGSHDVIGTGTIRSLAMTDPDDIRLVVPKAPPPAAAPVGASPAAGSPARSASPTARPSQISSAKASMASGAFRVVPPGDNRRATPPAGAPRARKSKLSLAIGALIAAGAVGAVVGVVANNYRHASQAASPPAGTGQSGTAPQGSAQPATPPAEPGPPSPAPPAAPQGSAQPITPPVAEQAGTDPPSPAPPHPGRPDTGRPAPARPEHVVAQPVPPPPPTPDTTSAAPVAKPAGCRVRINLTPWAYYMADDDPARHETPSTLVLAPGPHRLHVWNPELHIERDITLIVPPDRDTMNYSEPLQPPGTEPSR